MMPQYIFWQKLVIARIAFITLSTTLSIASAAWDVCNAHNAFTPAEACPASIGPNSGYTPFGIASIEIGSYAGRAIMFGCENVSTGGRTTPTYITCYNHASCPAGMAPDTSTGICQCAESGQQGSASSSCTINPKNAGFPKIGSCVGNPINAGTGNKFQQEIDYQKSPGRLGIIRSYNSDQVNRNTGFGNAWVSNYDLKIEAFGSNPYVMTALRNDGKKLSFTYTGSDWVASEDIDDELTELKSPSGMRIGWRYASTDGTQENYDVQGRLVGILYRSGEQLVVVYSDGTTGEGGGFFVDGNGDATSQVLPAGLLIRVIDTYGRQLNFGINERKQVVKMVDPDGGVYRYRYDEIGNLTQVTYPDLYQRLYIYNEAPNTSGMNFPTALTGIIDENNNRFSTYKYNSAGRAILTEHAGGADKVSIAYNMDTDGNITSSAVTDALNTTRAYAFTSILGETTNTGVTPPCTSGCGSASAMSYDSNGNFSSRSDFNGRVTSYAYDLARNLETSRIEASGTPSERVIATTWHPDFQLPLAITEPGKVTTFSYDTNGNLLSQSVASVP